MFLEKKINNKKSLLTKRIQKKVDFLTDLPSPGINFRCSDYRISSNNSRRWINRVALLRFDGNVKIIASLE